MIFVIDDNGISRTILRAWLVKAGFHSHAVIELNDPSTAFRLLTTNYSQVQIILTDVYFGGNSTIKNGVELVELIRAYERDISSEKPVYILAFSGSPEIASKIMAAGCDLFLPKPLKRQQVIDLVKSHYEP